MLFWRWLVSICWWCHHTLTYRPHHRHMCQLQRHHWGLTPHLYYTATSITHKHTCACRHVHILHSLHCTHKYLHCRNSCLHQTQLLYCTEHVHNGRELVRLFMKITIRSTSQKKEKKRTTTNYLQFAQSLLIGIVDYNGLYIGGDLFSNTIESLWMRVWDH